MSFWTPAFDEKSLFLMEYQVTRKQKYPYIKKKGHVDFWCYFHPNNCLFEFKSTYYHFSRFSGKIKHARKLFKIAQKQLENIPNSHFKEISMNIADSQYFKIAFITIPLYSNKKITEKEKIVENLHTGFQLLKPSPNWGGAWTLGDNPKLVGSMEFLEKKDVFCPVVLFFAFIKKI
jgi:hypothetical protein